MKVKISRNDWQVMKKSAVKSFPNECIGFYLVHKDSSNEMTIFGPKNFKNIAEDKTVISAVRRRDVDALLETAMVISLDCGDEFLVGQYHSHPKTGVAKQSVLDKRTGARWKAYRFQLILGLKSKSENSIRKKFYYYDKKTKKWKSGEIKITK